MRRGLPGAFELSAPGAGVSIDRLPAPPLPATARGKVNERRDETSIDELPFDKALARLEALADKLEGGDIPLEDALAVYEEAVGLFRHCSGRLAGVEQRLEKLTDDLDGTLATEPLEAPDSDTDD